LRSRNGGGNGQIERSDKRIQNILYHQIRALYHGQPFAERSNAQRKSKCDFVEGLFVVEVGGGGGEGGG